MAGTTPFKMGNQINNNPYSVGGATPVQGPYVGNALNTGAASPVAGMPNSPGFVQDYNPDTQSLLGTYEQKQAAANNDGFNQFKAEATRQGPSAWATLANQQLQNTTDNARDQARAVSAGTTAQTDAALASTGGLSSGARERAAEGGAKNTMSADQGLQRQDTQNQYQIASNDEQNKQQMLSQLPGMEQNQLNSWDQVASADRANQIAENQSENAYNLGIYNTNSVAAAANNTANAENNAANASANAPSLKNGFGITNAGPKGMSGTDAALYTSVAGAPIGALGQVTGWF